MKKSLPYILYTCLGMLFIFIAVNVNHASVPAFDLMIIHFIQGLEMPLLTTGLIIFTIIGSGIGIVVIGIVVVVLLFFYFDERRGAVLFAITMIGTGLINLILKLYFERDRPEIHRLADASGYSFPSGHAMGAFSLYVILAYLLWPNVKTKIGRFILIAFTVMMIFLISVSRIYLGVHYPTDIVGGFVMSALWLTFVLTVCHHFNDWSDFEWRR